MIQYIFCISLPLNCTKLSLVTCYSISVQGTESIENIRGYYEPVLGFVILRPFCTVFCGCNDLYLCSSGIPSKCSCILKCKSELNSMVFMCISLHMVCVSIFLQPASLFIPGAILALVLVFLFFMPLLLVFVYLLSFLFNKFETAQGVFPLILTWVSFFSRLHDLEWKSYYYVICLNILSHFDYFSLRWYPTV